MSFTYRGTSSDTMKFNVTERQVYNAPAFDVNAIEVPGRDGDLLNSQNRFQNKTITYTGFLREQDFPGDTKRERLSRGLRELKAWICGDAGHYHDLTDDYDPGFIRRAYISGETAINEILDQPDGVTLTITFRAEPFMYLEGNPFNVPETGTKSGDIATFTGVAAPLQSLIFDINPVQDLHGYANPWPGGGGKNLITPTESPDHVRRVTDVTYVEGNEEVTVTSSNANNYSCLGVYYNLKAGTYAFKYQATCSDSYVPLVTFYSGSTAVRANVQPNSATTFTLSADALIEMRMFTATSGNGSAGRIVRFYQMQLETGAAATAWTPYSNICPISGWTQVDGKQSGEDMTDYTPITISLGQTVYGGYEDALNGKLVIDKRYIEMNGTETWTEASISSGSAALGLKRYWTTFNASSYPAVINSPTMSNQLKTYAGNSWNVNTVASLRVESQNRYEVAVYSSDFPDVAAWKNYLTTHPLQAVYELATPIEIDLTPVSVSSLLGVNNVWCNTGSTEVVYIDPTENPTGFASKPLWEITMSGAGNLTVNGKTWSIGAYTGTLYCDTDIMDWYNSSSLQNDLVSGSDFPELQPGENIIFYTGGITNVKVTPRWRAL